MTEPPPCDEKSPDGQLVSDPVPTPLDTLREAVLGAADELTDGREGGGSAAAGAARQIGAGRSSITLERPRRSEFGDYSTNAALVLAPALGATPREVAGRLGDALAQRLGASPERFE